MKLEEVRGLFPIVRSMVYLDAASLSPYCAPVVKAMEEFTVERSELGSILYEEWYKRVEECRVLASNLLGASVEEVAFVKNTSEGVNLTAQMIRWRRGDEVLVCSCDFPTNIYPFLNLKDKGVRVRYVECRDGKVPVEELKRGIGGKTRLISISHVLYSSGYRFDLEEVGELCASEGLLLHVDAAQSLGALTVNVKRAGVDFLSAPGYKWLLSPLGTGVFYVKKERLSATPVLGWLSVKDPERLDTRRFEVEDSARRFETGNLNLSGLMGMRAALKLLTELGMRRVEERVLELSYMLAQELTERGLKVVTELADEHRSGIICVEKKGFSKDLLLKQKLVATVRANLRLSPHIYNNEEDLARAAELLSH